MDIFKDRYSVRNFKQDSIQKDCILSCLESARIAPSACNKQPWKFIVVDDKEIKNLITNEGLAGIHSFNKFVATAPVIVAVVAEPDIITDKLAASMQGVKYHYLDIGMACQNFVLKAWQYDIGSCYIGWFNEKKVKKILNVPKLKKVVLLIALGYFEKEEKNKKRKNLEEIYSFNSY
jgi:nitroreductase